MYSIKTNLTKAPNYYAVTFYDETGSPVGKCYIDTINVADRSPREQAISPLIRLPQNSVLWSMITRAKSTESIPANQSSCRGNL